MKTSKKIALAVLSVLIIILILWSAPYLLKLNNPAVMEKLQNWVSDLGFSGIIVLFIIQILQIIIAFIPGEPIEIISGALYGTLIGLAICLAGIIIGSGAIFAIVRKLGAKYMLGTRLAPKLAKYDFLQNEEKLKSLVFLLYLIPGTPKDILVYVCALTKISMKDFLIISTVARIPSIITSTMAGSSFISGNIFLSGIIFLAAAVISTLGIIYHNKRFGKN